MIRTNMEELEFQSKKERKQHIWVEKYRPHKLEDYLGNQMVKDTFKKYVADQDFCHLFLYGPPGTGKTTLAKMLVREIDCDFIYINASDERGIDTIRDKIKGFASSSGFKPLKVIIMDEADQLTQPAQASLRPYMEMYALTTRFILTGNYHEKILAPIMSRLQSFELIPPSKKEVAIYLTGILKTENVQYTPEEMAAVINAYYPDIRKCIQVCQQSSHSGVLRVSKESLVQYDVKNKIMEFLKVRAPLADIRRYIVDQNITRFEEIYQHLYDNLDKYAEGKLGSMILNLADAVRDDTLVANKQIIFLEFLVKSLKSLKNS